MSSVNKVILIGHLGRDPEIRYTASGTPVASFSIATSEKVKDKEYTEWHNIVAWRKLGEIAGEYLKKGSLVYIDGKIQSREYEGKDGSKRKAFEIIANQLRMLGGKQGERVTTPAPDSMDDFVSEAAAHFSEDDDVPL